MAQAVVILSLLAFFAVWNWFLYRTSGGRAWSPLWMAFSATAVAIASLVAGAAGYRLGRNHPFTTGSVWSDTVVWPQIWIGAGFALLAVFLWRAGLRPLRT